MILRHGQPIARLLPISHIPCLLISKIALRATQPQTSGSNIEIIESLREEARY